MAWTSPTSGEVTFGSTGPLTVDGDERQITEFPRHESKWGTIERLATKFRLRSDAATFALDFDDPSRTVAAR
ncbi:MAG: hypothetical protein U5R31_08730 [Acidimicrobiia bacterium]|nr:hypothetical protein [Acidimicrobiia bacterium]